MKDQYVGLQYFSKLQQKLQYRLYLQPPIAERV